MREQRLLFEVREPSWVDRLWERLDPKTRRQAIALLATMAKAALRQPRKERRDEP